MMSYDIFRPQNIVRDPKYVLFCKYNLRHFYERKKNLLENDFLVQLLLNARLCCSGCYVHSHE